LKKIERSRDLHLHRDLYFAFINSCLAFHISLQALLLRDRGQGPTDRRPGIARTPTAVADPVGGRASRQLRVVADLTSFVNFFNSFFDTMNIVPCLCPCGRLTSLVTSVNDIKSLVFIAPNILSRY